MRIKEAQILQDVGRVLEDVALSAGLGDEAIPADDVLSMYEAIEKKLVAKYADYPEVIEEIKRTVAEWNLIILAERDMPFDVMSLLYRKVEGLGYSHLLLEFDMKLIYARICIKHRKIDEAKITLNSIREKVSRLPKTKFRESYEKWVVSLEDKISNIM